MTRSRPHRVDRSSRSARCAWTCRPPRRAGRRMSIRARGFTTGKTLWAHIDQGTSRSARSGSGACRGACGGAEDPQAPARRGTPRWAFTRPVRHVPALQPEAARSATATRSTSRAASRGSSLLGLGRVAGEHGLGRLTAGSAPAVIELVGRAERRPAASVAPTAIAGQRIAGWIELAREQARAGVDRVRQRARLEPAAHRACRGRARSRRPARSRGRARRTPARAP